MKKLLAILFTASLFFSLGTNASAEELDYSVVNALELIESTNEAIDVKIEEGVKAADALQAQYLNDVRKTKSASEFLQLTKTYNANLDVIIDDVYNETLKMSQETIAIAAEVGIEAECSWVLVRFAHRLVWIDPIRVIGIGGH